jgi:hypothetical protein
MELQSYPTVKACRAALNQLVVFAIGNNTVVPVGTEDGMVLHGVRGKCWEDCLNLRWMLFVSRRQVLYKGIWTWV